ncbi:MAG: hypothetical protein P9L94_00640 [Candidatus Hinthialibacter antarcticus]|nr:hypothetical protein [Candidatus Hinthialibacter antarcticus]
MNRTCIAFFFALFIISAHADDHPAMVGWSLRNVETSDIRLQSGEGSVQLQYGAFVFRVPPNQKSSWLLTTTPIWPDWFPVANTQYRVDSQDANCSVDVRLLPNQNAPMIAAAAPSVISFQPGSKTGESIGQQQILKYYQHLPVDQIHITIKSGSSPLTFTLHQLDITNPTIGDEPLLKEFTFQAPDETTPPPGWNYLALPPSPYKLGDITPSATDAPLQLRGYSISGKLFELAPDRRVAATSLALSEDAPIEVNASGSDLFLLMSAHLIGKELHEGFSPRDAIRSPDWLVIEKRYADGAIERSMPYSLSTFKHEIANDLWSIYHVPVNPDKTLQKIVLRDAMPFGQIYLAAATLNPGESSMAYIQKPDIIQTLPIASTTEASAPQVSMTPQKQLTIANQHYQITFETQDAFSISSLKYVPNNREFLQNSSPLFSVISNGLRVPDDSWRLANYELDGATVSLTLNNIDPALPLAAKLFFAPTASDACEMRLRIENIGGAPVPLRVLFPALQSLSIHNDASKDIHFLPTERITWARGETRISAPHSGQMPQQWMDLYSDDYQCGLSIQTRDQMLVPKQFRLLKEKSGSRMGVEYGLEQPNDGFEKPLLIQGGEWFESSPTRVQIHGGDWRTPLAAHRDWLVSLKPITTRSNPIGNVFLCWRDYPYRGSGLTFSPAMNAYHFAPLLEELKREFGGVDMIELAGWMQQKLNSTSYLQSPITGDPNKLSLGSEINLRRNMEEMKSQSVHVSLVADPFAPLTGFESSAYLLLGYKNDDATLKYASEKQMNPNFGPWRQFAAHAYARRIQTLHGNALYFDRIGLGPLETLPGENALLQETYNELNKTSDRALYAERAPSDISTLHLDGALSYALAGGAYPTQIPINTLRFSQPQMRVIEKIHPSIHAHLLNPERAKLCVFQGVGMWLKGRPRSWYSPEFRQFVQDVYPIIRKHQDAFSSQNVEPLLPTLRPGVYANRFSTHEKHVITLFNNTADTASGRLFSFAAPKAKALCEWGMDDFSAAQTEDGVDISGSLHPKDVAIIVIEPYRPDTERETE